jgi:hypothetical protein
MKTLACLAASTAAVTAGALLDAGSAAAAISPKLAVTTTNSGGANLIVSAGVSNPAEDAFAKVQIYMPAGFGLKAPAGGATVGTAGGHALVKDVDATQEQNYNGKVVAIATNDPAIAWENANCDNAPHAAAWSMQVIANDGSANVPIFVDRTTGAEAQLGPYKLVICLRSPDLPQNDPNRMPTAIKFDSFLLTLTGFTLPTKAGDYRWRSLWTPYAPGTGTPNTAGNVEAQSVVRVPSGVLALAAHKAKRTVKGKLRTQVRLAGKVTIGGEAAGRIRVAFSHGSSLSKLVSMGSVRATAAGAFSTTSLLTKPTYFQAGVTVARQELGPGACTASFGAAVKCVSASIGGFRLLSRPIRVAP